jgi:hypothetical protein
VATELSTVHRSEMSQSQTREHISGNITEFLRLDEGPFTRQNGCASHQLKERCVEVMLNEAKVAYGLLRETSACCC